MLSKRAKKNQDTATIMKMLPDIELSAQILVNSILAPKDMTTLELIYEGPKHLFSPELSANVLARVKLHFEEGYDFKKIVPEMLREPLFEKGSYPIAVIPENVIDAVINSDRGIGVESRATLSRVFREDGLARGIGILGHPKHKENAMKFGLSLEDRLSASKRTMSASAAEDDARYYMSYSAEDLDVIDKCVAVTDNPSVLRVPLINELVKQKAVHKAYGGSDYRPGLESVSEEKINDMLIERAIYRYRPIQSSLTTELPYQNELKRNSVGSPLVMKLPSESVLPVHVPGNPKQHVGYFVLLDEEGNPLESPDGDIMHPQAQKDAGNSITSNLMKRAAINMGLDEDRFDARNIMHVRELTRMYSEMVERDLIARVRNGVYTGNVTIAKNEEVYRLMMSRVLSKQHCQLLYIPVEYMTYVAFKYTDDGIGKSLIDEQSMLHVIRSILMFTDVLASVKNSIGRTRVSAQLDPKDSNPRKTIDMLQDEIIRSRTVQLPYSISSPADIHDFIQRLGYEWEFTGHPGIPDMKFDFQATGTDYRKSDTDLQEYLRKTSIMGLGLSPETVDNGFNSEFATTAIHNNVLLSKRVIAWQDEFTPQITNHARKIILHTESIKEDIKSLLEANYDDINLKLTDEEKKNTNLSPEMEKKIVINRALHEFLAGFNIGLPRPVSATLETQSDELSKYMSTIDSALDAYLSNDIFSQSVTGDMSDSFTNLKAMVKAYFVRKWMAEKNMFPELSELTATGDNGKLITDVCKEVVSYTQDISKFGVELFTQLKSNKDAVDKDLANQGIELSSSGFGGSSSDSTDDGLGGFDSFDGLGGDAGSDPFSDIGADLGGTDTQTTEDQTQAPEPEDESTPTDTTKNENKPDNGSGGLGV
jgi:hypothetical protein